MDDFSIALAMEQTGQAEAAAEDALEVSFAPDSSLGALDKADKPFPFTGLVLTGATIGAALWLLRR